MWYKKTAIYLLGFFITVAATLFISKEIIINTIVSNKFISHSGENYHILSKQDTDNINNKMCNMLIEIDTLKYNLGNFKELRTELLKELQICRMLLKQCDSGNINHDYLRQEINTIELYTEQLEPD